MADSGTKEKAFCVINQTKAAAWAVAILLFLLLASSPPALAQGQPVIVVTGADASEFPTVRLTVIGKDGQGNRLETLPGLVVSEDGSPATILDLGETLAGVEYFFVIDANETFETQDQPDGLTRREMVRDSIVEFATNFMNQAQMDRVSLIVPDEEGSTLLLDRSQFHTSLINEINFFEPENLAETPLNTMLDDALNMASESGAEGRDQAIILFTDAGQLGDQLDFETLTNKARDIGVPIHSIILGARADEDEIGYVTLLAEPTGGSYLHLEEIASAVPLFEMLQNGGRQHLIAYRSQIASPGEHTVTVEAGGTQGSLDIEVDVSPPLVEMAVDNSMPIRRVLESAEAPIEEAQPPSQPIVARVSWPDGYPRTITQVTLIIDGVEQGTIENPELIEDSLIAVDWDLTGVDEGDYALVMSVTDELGIVGESQELTMNVEVARPAPAAATEVVIQPTSVPEPSVEEETSNLIDRLGVVGIVIIAAAVLAVFFVVVMAIVLLVRRSPKPQPVPVAAPAMPPDSAEATQVMMPAFAAKQAARAFLEPLENAPEHSGMIPVPGENVAIGRDKNLAQIVFANKSVSRLHARIMMRGGQFQLYDEGSASGTYINYEQVSLTPQNIQDKDDLHFGQVHVKFHVTEGMGDDDATQIMQAPVKPKQASPVSDEQGTQPYMPNQPPPPGSPPAPDDDEDISTQPYMPHGPKR